jgi:hypothetical protein
MPRKTTLSIISERPVADQAAMQSAAAAIEAAGPQLAPPQDILAELRRTNAQLTHLVVETQGRAEQAEAALQETTMAADAQRQQITQAAASEVSKIRADATKAVQQAMAQGAVAEKTAAVAAQVRQTTGMLAQFGSFLIGRAPVLATLAGAYFLARDMLPTPGAMQLGLLGIYGATAVFPAVCYGLRCMCEGWRGKRNISRAS